MAKWRDLAPPELAGDGGAHGRPAARRQGRGRARRGRARGVAWGGGNVSSAEDAPDEAAEGWEGGEIEALHQRPGRGHDRPLPVGSGARVEWARQSVALESEWVHANLRHLFSHCSLLQSNKAEEGIQIVLQSDKVLVLCASITMPRKLSF